MFRFIPLSFRSALTFSLCEFYTIYRGVLSHLFKGNFLCCLYLLFIVWCKVLVLVSQSCLTLRDPMNCSPPGSSVHGTLQARNWSGLPFPSPEGLPEPGIEPRSPALLAECCAEAIVFVYPTLLTFLVTVLPFIVDSLPFFRYTLMSAVHRDDFILFFSTLKFLIALTSTSNAVLKAVEKMGFPDLFVTLLGMPRVFLH